MTSNNISSLNLLSTTNFGTTFPQAQGSSVDVAFPKTMLDEIEKEVMRKNGLDPEKVDDIKKWNSNPNKNILIENYKIEKEMMANNNTKSMIKNLGLEEYLGQNYQLSSFNEESFDVYVKDYFSSDNLDKKLYLIAIEKAKNMDSSNWETLPDQKRIELITKQVEELSRLNENEKERILDETFCKLAVANAKGMALQDFESLLNGKDDKKAQEFSDYIFEAIEQILLSADVNKFEINSNYINNQNKFFIESKDNFVNMVLDKISKNSKAMDAFVEAYGVITNDKDITSEKLEAQCNCVSTYNNIVKAYNEFIKNNPDLVKELGLPETMAQITYNSLKDKQNLSESDQENLKAAETQVKYEQKLNATGMGECSDEAIQLVEGYVSTSNVNICFNPRSYAEDLFKSVQAQFMDGNGKIPSEKMEEFCNFASEVAVAFERKNGMSISKDITGLLADFKAGNNIEETSINSGTVAEARVLNAIGMGATATKTTISLTFQAVKKGSFSDNGNGENYVDAVIAREDAKEVLISTNSMIVNDKDISDEDKKLYAEYVTSESVPEEYRAKIIEDLLSYNNEAFNKGVNNSVTNYSPHEDSSSTTKTGGSSNAYVSVPSDLSRVQNNIINNINEKTITTTSNNSDESSKLIELKSGERVSLKDAIASFDSLSHTDKKLILNSLSATQKVKLPVTICEEFDELIKPFISDGQGIAIIQKCNIHAGDVAIREMKKTQEGRMELAMNVSPERLSKATYMELKENHKIEIAKGYNYNNKA